MRVYYQLVDFKFHSRQVGREQAALADWNPGQSMARAKAQSSRSSPSAIGNALSGSEGVAWCSTIRDRLLERAGAAEEKEAMTR